MDLDFCEPKLFSDSKGVPPKVSCGILVTTKVGGPVVQLIFDVKSKDVNSHVHFFLLHFF